VNDLKLGSEALVVLECDECGHKYETHYVVYNNMMKKNNGRIVCYDCRFSLTKVNRRNVENGTAIYKNITNFIFGNLKAIEIDYDNNNIGSTYWICQCSCGNYISVSLGNLLNGKQISCGCNPRIKPEDLTGNIYGKLTVIREDVNKNIQFKNDGKNRYYWLCLCSCDNPNLISFRSDSLKSGERTSCGCNISDENWKSRFKGIDPNNPRQNPEYFQWRQSVFKRDGYKCCCCGSNSELNAHHIENFSSNKSLRTNVNNGISLCENCHSVNIYGGFHNIYGTRNNTKEQLLEYLFSRNEYFEIPDWMK